MKNVDFVNCESDVKETVIYEAKPNSQMPLVQFVINILTNNTATVKIFLPKHPAEHSLAWWKDQHPDEAKELTETVNRFIYDRGAKITYYGF